MKHKTLIHLIDSLNNEINGFELELPVIRGEDHDSITFNSDELPEQLEPLKHSGLMFPIHKVNQSALKNADKIITYCNAEFGRKACKSFSEDDIESIAYDYELSVNMIYKKSKSGHVYVEDLEFLNSISVDTIDAVVLLNTEKGNCHYHPSGYFNKSLKTALLSAADSINSIKNNWQEGILSYYNNELKLWLYYVLPTKNKSLISIAPEMIVDSNDSYEIDGTVTLIDEKKEVMLPEIKVKKINNYFLTLTRFYKESREESTIFENLFENINLLRETKVKSV